MEKVLYAGTDPDIHTAAASQITLSSFVLHRNIWTVLRRIKSAFDRCRILPGYPYGRCKSDHALYLCFAPKYPGGARRKKSAFDRCRILPGYPYAGCKSDHALYLCFAPKYMDGASEKKERFLLRTATFRCKTAVARYRSALQPPYGYPDAKLQSFAFDLPAADVWISVG